MESLYAGIDLGGTGSRLGIWQAGTCIYEVAGPGVKISVNGSDLESRALDLLKRGLTWLESHGEQRTRLTGVAVGATGFPTLMGDEPAKVLERFGRQTPHSVVAFAPDVVTAHLGALGGSDGAVIAVGTGTIALGTNFADIWRRVDGWGHILGDRGSGAWIGMAGLRIALAHHDQTTKNGAILLAAAQRRFGDLGTWPQTIYTASNRAGILASFAEDVISLGLDETTPAETSSQEIVAQAVSALGDSLLSAAGQDIGPKVSAVGGVMESGVQNLVRQYVLAQRSDLQWCEPQGSPLVGAGVLARLVSDQGSFRNGKPLQTTAPFIWARPHLGVTDAM